jgi:hypothetical protein
MSLPKPDGVPNFLLTLPAGTPPPGTKSNFVDPPTLQPAILTTCSVLMFVATLFVAARIYSALKITRRVGWEDYACVVAAILSFTYVGFIIDLSYAARHMWDVPAWWFSDVYWKVRFAQNTVLPFAFIATRLPFFLLYLRVFGTSKPFRFACYFGMTFYVIANVVEVPIYTYYCAPLPGKPWASLETLMRCATAEPVSIMLGAVNIFSDIYILILPMPMIWKLQMSLERKLGIMAIFTTGLFVLIASCIGMNFRWRLVYLQDTNWNEGSFVCAT